MELTAITPQMIDSAVNRQLKRAHNRQHLTRTCERSSEFVDYVYNLVSMLDVMPEGSAVMATALCIGIEIGLELQQQRETVQ